MRRVVSRDLDSNKSYKKIAGPPSQSNAAAALEQERCLSWYSQSPVVQVQVTVEQDIYCQEMMKNNSDVCTHS